MGVKILNLGNKTVWIYYEYDIIKNLKSCQYLLTIIIEFT